MHEKVGRFGSFAARRMARRESFDHDVIVISKPYPDSQLLLERRGMQRHELERGRFCQLNLYTTQHYNLPEELFLHPEINRYRQQLGRKGLIAAAGLWLNGSVATIVTLQSDLCQHLYRHPDLKKSCKSQVETHFKYWYAILFNAILDFCADSSISVLNSPTAHQVVAHTAKEIRPDLFFRIYDYPRDHYHCSKVAVRRAEYWEIPISANIDRLMRLAVRNIETAQTDAQPKICIFHDIEENVDTDVSPSECADNLARILEIEKSFGINTTYNILGLLFSTKYPEIISSNGAHSIGFHSFNHNIADVEQLARCRHVDLRVRGYRPPRSLMTAELTDYDLTFFNFEWLANGVRSPTQIGCELQNGLVKIPIHRDDYLLFTGAVGYEQWERGVLDAAQGKALFGIGLHDCYGGKWLRFYAALLDKLAATGTFAGADEICDQMFLMHPVIPGRDGALLPEPRTAAPSVPPQSRKSEVFARLAGWLPP
jgi:hypothetical protein